VRQRSTPSSSRRATVPPSDVLAQAKGVRAARSMPTSPSSAVGNSVRRTYVNEDICEGDRRWECREQTCEGCLELGARWLRWRRGEEEGTIVCSVVLETRVDATGHGLVERSGES
jgi:hypothetical protein